MKQNIFLSMSPNPCQLCALLKMKLQTGLSSEQDSAVKDDSYVGQTTDELTLKKKKKKKE